MLCGLFLNQTFEDFEIIISDNCSEDDTPETAKQFTDPRVRYVRTPRHYTIPDSWEFARSFAKGKLIIMLSDDDALVDSALEHFQQQAERYDADFVFSRVVEYYDQSFPGTDRIALTVQNFPELAGGLRFRNSLVRLRVSAEVPSSSERLCIFKIGCRHGGPADRPFFLDKWRGILSVAHHGSVC